MKTNLNKEDFSFICPLKTEDMSAVEGGYFCQKCDKKVHDVTKMNHDEFERLKSKSSNLCVTIQKVVAVSFKKESDVEYLPTHLFLHQESSSFLTSLVCIIKNVNVTY